MKRKNRFVFKMEGPEQNDHHLDLSVFVEKIRQFLDLLTHSAKGATFRVVGLSHSSPATLECEPVAKGDLDTNTIFDMVNGTFRLMEEGQARCLSHPVLSDMEHLATISPERIARAEIQTIAGDDEDKRVYKLDERFREKLCEARKVEDRIFSTIDGKLEQINIHNNANTFKIYTFASSVSCKFPKNLLGAVQGALGSFVSISGECFYRPDAAFPYKIDVQEMKIHPPGEELPSLGDLYGIAPDATREKTSEKFVRELRDQWSKDTQ